MVTSALIINKEQLFVQYWFGYFVYVVVNVQQYLPMFILLTLTTVPFFCDLNSHYMCVKLFSIAVFTVFAIPRRILKQL